MSCLILPRRRAVLTALLALVACSPVTGEDDGTVDITVRMVLAGGRDMGATPARIYVYSELQPVARHEAYPQGIPSCPLDQTPVTTCTVAVPRGETVTVMVAESDPAVFVRFEPASPQDTVRDGRYVEFTGWSDCPDAPDRGLCVLRPGGDLTLEGNFQLMQQVTIYQTGVARMDWITFAAAPMLKVPAENDNILDLSGCRRVFNPPAAPCDSLRVVGDVPMHRFTAYVPRQTIVGMFPVDGPETQFVRWDGDCIPSGLFGGGVCSLISPNVSGEPILLTLRYQWWACPDGPSDRDLPGMGCTLQGGEPAGSSRGPDGLRQE
jgi:hypothetical protein